MKVFLAILLVASTAVSVLLYRGAKQADNDTQALKILLATDLLLQASMSNDLVAACEESKLDQAQTIGLLMLQSVVERADLFTEHFNVAAPADSIAIKQAREYLAKHPIKTEVITDPSSKSETRRIVLPSSPSQP